MGSLKVDSDLGNQPCFFRVWESNESHDHFCDSGDTEGLCRIECRDGEWLDRFLSEMAFHEMDSNEYCYPDHPTPRNPVVTENQHMPAT